jgi:hypothetical protein
MNQQRLLLVVLLGVLALSLGYAFWATPRQTRVPGGSGEVRRQTVVSGVAEALPTTGLSKVQLDVLGKEPVPYSGAERDIFNYRQKPVRVVSPPPKKALPVTPVPPPPVPHEVVQKTLSQYTFLGFLEAGGRPIVFLSSAGEIYVLRQGERFGRAKEFEVADIKDNVLTIQHIGQMGTEKIFLVEKDKPDFSVSAPARIAPLPAPPDDSMNGSQRMGAPARRGRVLAPATGLDRAQQGLTDVENADGFGDQDPSTERENPEGEGNGTK